jgi:hypothetical protein
MKPVMPKPSPQLMMSAAASALALAALALNASSIGGPRSDHGSPVSAVVGIDLPVFPTLPALFPR